MTIVRIKWGRHRVYGKPWRGHRGKKLTWANSAPYLGATALYEQQTPVRILKLPDAVDSDDLPSDIFMGPGAVTSLHEQEYDLAAGTVVTLWLDRGDDRGRFANYPAWVECRVVDQPITPENTFGDEWASIAPVEYVRTVWKESALFMHQPGGSHGN